MQKLRGIIPFSGGIDSTAVLYDTLKTYPEDNFLVFRVNLISSSSASRTVQEIAAVENILNKLKEMGMTNFLFKTLDFNYSSLGPPPVWDSEVVNYCAGICLNAYPDIYEFYEGAILNDYHQEGFQDRLDHIKQLLFLAGRKNENNLKIVFPLKDMDKYRVMQSLPIEILKLTWSCRYPVGGLPNYTLTKCHACQPCRMIDEVLAKNPDEFPGM